MLLSIISPTYNEADNIIKFVNSIELTLRKYDYEIIFVDDNSSDKTHEIIKNLSTKKPHVRCLRRIGRRGLLRSKPAGVYDPPHLSIAPPRCFEIILTVSGAICSLGTWIAPATGRRQPGFDGVRLSAQSSAVPHCYMSSSHRARYLGAVLLHCNNSENRKRHSLLPRTNPWHPS